MSEKHTCCGSVWRGWAGGNQTCGKNAKHEHEGKWYCKTHHPPSVNAKDEARRAIWAAERAESERKRKVAAERERKADAYDQLAERNAELVEALRKIAAIEDEMYGGDWEEIEKARGIADAALAKCQPKPQEVKP